MSAGAPSAELVEALEYVPATRAHKQALSRFVCTDPPKKLYEVHRGKHHPAPWELDLQSKIRTMSIPPVPGSESLMLGMIDGKIATVSYVSFDTSGTQLLIRAVARAWEFRGHGLGSLALQMTVAGLRHVKQSLDLDCGIWAHAHFRNETSLKMLGDAGFVEIDGPNDFGLISLVLDH